jgi:hypothetical protein
MERPAQPDARIYGRRRTLLDEVEVIGCEWRE